MIAEPWLSVLTTPRRPQYLAETLEAILAAGGADFPGRLVVFVDGPTMNLRAPPPFSIWSLTNEAPSAGVKTALWTILHMAAKAGIPYLLYFEDDVRLARNAIPAMQRSEVVPPFDFLSFLKMNPDVLSEPGIQALPEGTKFWGTQAMKIPDRSLARFLSVQSTAVGYSFAGDVWLGEQLKAGIVLPAIVRHVGAVSAIPGQENHTLEGWCAHRAGLDYVGDDVDALEALS